jgi:hypothetical protein
MAEIDVFWMRFNADDRKKLYEKFGTTDKSELIKKIKALALAEETPRDPNELTMEQIEYRTAKAKMKIAESQATYWETFKQPPSPQAKIAMTTARKSEPIPKPNDLDITKFLSSTYIDKFGWYHAVCNRCNFVTGTGRDFESAAIRDLESHVLQNHKEAWK